VAFSPYSLETKGGRAMNIKERAEEWKNRWDGTIDAARICKLRIPDDIKECYDLIAGLLTALAEQEEGIKQLERVIEDQKNTLVGSKKYFEDKLAEQEEADKEIRTICGELPELPSQASTVALVVNLAATLITVNNLLVEQEARSEKAGKEIERLNAGIKAAYSTLQMFGVPELRAKSVANGIMVLVSRIDKESESQAQKITEQAKQLRQLAEENSLQASRIKELEQRIAELDGENKELSANYETAIKDGRVVVVHRLVDIDSETRAAAFEEAATLVEQMERDRWERIGDPRTPVFTAHFAAAIRAKAGKGVEG
jgi:phage shock protein A